MSRRKKKNDSAVPWPLIRVIGFGFLVMTVVIVVGLLIKSYFLNADVFTVQKVVISPELTMIQKEDLLPLKGQSMFLINLTSLQQRLSQKYPRLTGLEIYKEFPNQLRIIGVDRSPMSQILIDSKYYLLDRGQAVLDRSEQENSDFPTIIGSDVFAKNIEMGRSLKDSAVATALTILNRFQESGVLQSLTIREIDIQNLTKIKMIISNGITLLVDGTDLDQKVENLNFVVSQSGFDFNQVSYIDLRFREPIVGRK